MANHKELIERACYLDRRAAEWKSRGDDHELSYSLTQRNWCCEQLRKLGFKIPVPVYDNPSILTDALKALAGVAEVAA